MIKKFLSINQKYIFLTIVILIFVFSFTATWNQLKGNSPYYNLILNDECDYTHHCLTIKQEYGGWVVKDRYSTLSSLPAADRRKFTFLFSSKYWNPLGFHGVNDKYSISPTVMDSECKARALMKFYVEDYLPESRRYWGKWRKKKFPWEQPTFYFSKQCNY